MPFAPALDKRAQSPFAAYNQIGDILDGLRAGSLPEFDLAQVSGDAVFYLSTPCRTDPRGPAGGAQDQSGQRGFRRFAGDHAGRKGSFDGGFLSTSILIGTFLF
jgi:hypothetical protein